MEDSRWRRSDYLALLIVLPGFAAAVSTVSQILDGSAVEDALLLAVGAAAVTFLILAPFALSRYRKLRNR